MDRRVLIVAVVVGGLFEGAALGLLTIVLSKSDMAGAGFSLRGNGALVVPFGLGPALLAGQLAMLVLHLRSHKRWWVYGVAVMVLGVAFALGSFLPAAVIARGQPPDERSPVIAVQQLLTFLSLFWILVAPGLAAVVPSPADRSHSRGIHLAALGILPATLVGGLFASMIVLSSLWS
jgi:hypothetical protein